MTQDQNSFNKIIYTHMVYGKGHKCDNMEGDVCYHLWDT
jgi:hypothetical protein